MNEHRETAAETETETEAERWERRYAASDRLWSGRVNPVLRDYAAAMNPARSLDIGCGEGADVLWLAEQGWSASGVDLSATAVQRARAEAERRGLGERARFTAGDVLAGDSASASAGAGEFELVTGFFLHGDDELRTRVLRRAAAAVAPGGRLLLVSHATMPPWSGHPPQEVPISPDGDEEILDLGVDWRRERAEVRERSVTGPNGESAVLTDSVLLLRRGSSV